MEDPNNKAEQEYTPDFNTPEEGEANTTYVGQGAETSVASSGAPERNNAIYYAVQTFGQHGAPSEEAIVRRAETIRNYIENGESE